MFCYPVAINAINAIMNREVFFRMKRMLALLVSVMLLLSVASCANAAKLFQKFEVKAAYYGFEITIPGDWIIDQEEKQDNYGNMYFGMMYNPEETLSIESKLNFYGDWAEDFLGGGDADLWAEYEAFLLDDFSEESPEIVAKPVAGDFPGIVIKATGDYGTYLYGEIMINAYAYGFNYYRWNSDGTINSDITQDDIDTLASILETYVLVQKAE